MANPHVNALFGHELPHQIRIVGSEVGLLSAVALVTKRPKIVLVRSTSPMPRNLMVDVQLDMVCWSPSAHLAGTVIAPKDVCA